MPRVLAGWFVVCMLAGCGSGSTASNPVATEKSARKLESAFSSANENVKKYIESAARALKENRFDQAFAALELARNEPSLTPAQSLALQQSMHTVQKALAEAVERG